MKKRQTLTLGILGEASIACREDPRGRRAVWCLCGQLKSHERWKSSNLPAKRQLLIGQEVGGKPSKSAVLCLTLK